LLKTEEVFRFCAIPQVMAIATLEELYNNPKVFTGVVKLRRGMTAKLILDTCTTSGLHKWFNKLSRKIISKCPRDDPSAGATKKICNEIIVLTDGNALAQWMHEWVQTFAVVAPVALAYSANQLTNAGAAISWDSCMEQPRMLCTAVVSVVVLVAHAFRRGKGRLAKGDH